MGMDFEEAKEKYGNMIYRYMPQYKIYGYTLDDMENIGLFVLWRCCQHYNPNEGVKFSTYFVRSMKYECYSMNRLSNVSKRCGDKYCHGLTERCSCDSDITYADVIASLVEVDNSLEQAIQSLFELTNSVYEKDRPIIQTFLYEKIYGNHELTRKELGDKFGCSYIKIRRIIDDFRYLIKKEWGI